MIQGDPLTHLGIINNIITTGHIEVENFYPITHIYLVQLSEILNISPNIFHKCIPFIFGLFSVLFIHCLAKTTLPKKGQVLLATVIFMAFLTPLNLILEVNVRNMKIEETITIESNKDNLKAPRLTESPWNAGIMEYHYSPRVNAGMSEAN